MGIGQKQPSLTEIVEHQGGRHDREPAELDRQRAKMTHVGVHGLVARERQKGGAKDGKGDAGSRVTEVKDGMMWADRAQDGRGLQDATEAEHTDRDEPYQHYWPENVADELGSFALDEEQTDEDHDGDGDDRRRERRRIDLQAFYGTEHRDCGRDYAVAIEQRGPDQADDEKAGTRTPAWCVPCIEKGEQRHDAAFAVIVGAQDQDG